MDVRASKIQASDIKVMFESMSPLMPIYDAKTWTMDVRETAEIKTVCKYVSSSANVRCQDLNNRRKEQQNTNYRDEICVRNYNYELQCWCTVC